MLGELLQVEDACTRIRRAWAVAATEEAGSAEGDIDLGAGDDRLKLACELVGLPDVTRVALGHVVTAPPLEAAVHRSRHTKIALPDDANFSAEALKLSQRPVGRAVVDDNYLIGRMCLGEDRRQRLCNVALGVVDRHHRTDRRCLHGSTGSRPPRKASIARLK